LLREELAEARRELSVAHVAVEAAAHRPSGGATGEAAALGEAAARLQHELEQAKAELLAANPAEVTRVRRLRY
jgi:uncharacterized protein (DUF58 family)